MSWFQFEFYLFSLNSRSLFLSHCVSLVYINVLAYAFLTVDLCKTKSAYATKHHAFVMFCLLVAFA